MQLPHTRVVGVLRGYLQAANRALRARVATGVLRVAEERVRSLLEYRGSFNRFDLRISKVQADGLHQLFLRFGEARTDGMGSGAPPPP